MLNILACAFKMSSEKNDYHVSTSKVQKTKKHFSA